MSKVQWKKRWSALLHCTQKTAAEMGGAARLGAKKVEQTAEHAVAYTQLKIHVMEVNGEIRTRLRQVGEMVYATHSGVPTDSGALPSALEQIDQLKDEVRRSERALAALRGLQRCSACGAPNGTDNLFCSNCGRPLKE